MGAVQVVCQPQRARRYGMPHERGAKLAQVRTAQQKRPAEYIVRVAKRVNAPRSASKCAARFPQVCEMFARISHKCGLRLRGRRGNPQYIRFMMRGDMRTTVHMQTPLLLPSQPRQRFAPRFRIAAHHFVQFIPVRKNRTEPNRHDGPSVHRALKDTLMHAGLPAHPTAVGQICVQRLGTPLRGIDIPNNQGQISVSNGTGAFSLGQKTASG